MKQELDDILARVEQRIEGGEAPPPIKVHEVEVDDLIDYIVCPAKYYLSVNSELKSNRKIVRLRSRKALNELVFNSVSKDFIDTKLIDNAMQKVFQDLSYDQIEKDRLQFVTSAIRLSNMISDNGFVIHSPLKPVTYNYNNTVINSDMSMAIMELRNRFIYPVVIDFSKTAYEPSYNPIIYRAHILAEHFELKGSTTNINVFSIGSGKRWIYDHIRYFSSIRASLNDSIEMLRAEMYPLRFGWWCSSCDYKGLCHKKFKKK